MPPALPSAGRRALLRGGGQGREGAGGRWAAGGTLPARPGPRCLCRAGPAPDTAAGRPRALVRECWCACVSGGRAAQGGVCFIFTQAEKSLKPAKKEKTIPGEGGWASLPSWACAWWGWPWGGGGGGTRSIGGWGGVCHPGPRGGAPKPWRPARHEGRGEPGRSDPLFVSWGRKGADDSDRQPGATLAGAPKHPELRMGGAGHWAPSAGPARVCSQT